MTVRESKESALSRSGEGRDLDLRVAEHVLGWKRGKRFGNGNGEWIRPDDVEGQYRLTWESTPRFSTDIAAAWTIIGDMAFTTGEFGVSRTASDEYFAEYVGVLSQDTRRAGVYAKTAPLAICLCALDVLSQPHTR